MYRPQYIYPAPPPGFEDEQFSYIFDSTNTPTLVSAIATTQQIHSIPLPLESDSPFICRGIHIRLGTGHSNLYFELKTPHGDYMQTTFVPIARYAGGSGAAIVGFTPAPVECEVECPAGSNWTLYLYNPTTGNVTPPSITLLGVKRRLCKKFDPYYLTGTSQRRKQ